MEISAAEALAEDIQERADRPPLSHALGLLKERAAILSDLVDALERRLEPVMGADHARAVRAVETETKPTTSPVTNTIEVVADDLQTVASQVSILLERLEV